MKLKQRVVGLLSLAGGAALMFLALNIVSYQRVSIIDEADPHKGDRLLQSFHSESEDKASNSNNNVASIIHALQTLHIPGAVPSSGFNADAEAKKIAQKLIMDSSFRNKSADINLASFIRLGQLLDEYSVKQHGANNTDSRAIPGHDKSRYLWQGGKHVSENKPRIENSSFPVFYLSHEAFESMTGYVNRHAEEHGIAKKNARTPMSFRIHKGTSLKNWQKWQNGINQDQVYNERTPLVDNFLKDMATAEITGLSTLPDYGTQIKLVFKYKDGSQGLFKPMRWRRNQERDPNLYYFDDFERHQAEIAAFHLDRVMQFYRVPPNTGRFINISSTIEPFASRSLKRTIYTSPSGNICFYGKCDYYCDSGHPVCGHPDVVEGAMAAWLPFGRGTSKKSWENPWRRSYSKFRKAEWETDPNYCDTVKQTVPYNTGRRLLDLMDITIFDYIAGNQDRHHYHTFKVFGNQSSPVLYDNGRGFGWIRHDDTSILVPVVQCCRIRYSTLAKLLKYDSGPYKLSVLMRRSLARDPISSGPHGLVLSEGHLRALDRRVSKVLDTVWKCMKKRRAAKVVIDDGY